MPKLKITVDGKLYEVDVEIFEPEQPHPGYYSPPGQTIQVNDVLLVLEAMKMETVITAPIAGKVAKVNVNVGDAVQQGMNRSG